MRSAIILLTMGALASACNGHGPVVDVCISFPEKGGFVCVDREQKPYFKDYKESIKYVAFSPDDAQKLIEACGISNKNKSVVQIYLRRAETVAMRSQ